jgi:hypothetical protein
VTAELSVVVAAPRGGEPLRRCLESLASQERLREGALEVVVAIGPHTGDGAGEAPERLLRVRTVTSVSDSLPFLLGAGIAASSGGLVAVTEEVATFEPDWAASVLDVQKRTGAAALGGSVCPADGIAGFDLAAFLCDYAAFLPPFPAGLAAELLGLAAVFTREALPGAGDVAARGFWKTFHCRSLVSSGRQLYLDPALRVSCGRRLSFTAWARRRLLHGRCYGAMRATGWSVTRRIFHILASPTVPFLLFLRVARHVWPRPRFRSKFLAVSPGCLVAQVLWAAGEAVGLLLGAGTSGEKL